MTQVRSLSESWGSASNPGSLWLSPNFSQPQFPGGRNGITTRLVQRKRWVTPTGTGFENLERRRHGLGGGGGGGTQMAMFLRSVLSLEAPLAT